MLMTFQCKAGVDAAPDAERLRAADWIDLDSPTPAEMQAVTEATGLRVPAATELTAIESSSRLAASHGVLYLSMPWLVGVAGGAPRATALGFVLSPDRLVTVHFGESSVLKSFAAGASAQVEPDHGAAHLFVGILEGIVDRFADVLERIGGDLDTVSATIFADGMASGARPKAEDRELRRVLRDVGRSGDLVARIRDSLLAVGRIVPYVSQVAESWVPSDVQARLHTLRQDVHSLAEYDAQLTSTVQFLLDATLGFISIAQNNIIKVLTVVSVVGIPPTLVASIYGMNFKTMPELDWAYGYPYGLGMIVLTAILPLVVFRLKGWF
jgi:magnesium transporter